MTYNRRVYKQRGEGINEKREGKKEYWKSVIKNFEYEWRRKNIKEERNHKKEWKS